MYRSIALIVQLAFLITIFFTNNDVVKAIFVLGNAVALLAGFCTQSVIDAIKENN